MLRRRDRLYTVVAILAFLSPWAWSPLGAAEFGEKGAVWIVHEMVRLGPAEPAGKNASISIEAGRGEYVAVQVAVRATGEALANVRVTASALQGPETISPDNIEVYRESFITLPTSTPHDGTSRPMPAGIYPDGLIPTRDPADGKAIPAGAQLRAQNHTIPAGETQPYWIDIFVSRAAAAGTYTGTITVEADQGTATLKVELTVWRFTLPLIPSLKSSFQMWVNSHGRQDYLELMKHRIMPVAPRSYDPDLGKLGMSQNDLGFFSGAGYGNCSMSPPPPRDELRSATRHRTAGIALYNFTADEIGECGKLVKTVRQWGETLHDIGARQMVTMPPRPDLLDSVDIWVMLPRQFVDNPPDVTALRARGAEIWSYTAMNQDDYSPKWQIDFSPMNHRIYGLINQSVGATGLLYWTVDSWTSDPWTNAYSWQGTYPGDGFLVYPGANVGLSTIVPSMRLKYIRAAVQDYEYVELLSKAGRREWALETIRPIARDWKRWSDDPDQLRSVRHRLAVELDRLTAEKGIAPGGEEDGQRKSAAE